MEKKIVTLSIAIATFNEEGNLGSCLSSVAGWADEIVVVDGGSSDKTVSIAKSFNANVIRTDNPLMFHINKQKALDACTGRWILQLDADEAVSKELKEEIQSVVRVENKNVGFYIPRKNFFWGHWMRKGGQYPDYVIRLFLRGKGKFPQVSVHEQIIVDGSVGYLYNPLLHNSYKNLSDYWNKADTYTTLAANEFRANRLPKTFHTLIDYCLIKPVVTFFSLFVRHKGFVDGHFGFIFAVFSSLHHPWAFIKYKRLLLFLLLLLSLSAPIHAEYVLPYPSYMPGNKLYKVSMILDSIKKVWSFGSISSLKYQINMSDKYLVEAKTLFEYKQYLLAIDALKRSNFHAAQLTHLIERGTQEGKDMKLYKQKLKNAMIAHQEVISKLRRDLPVSFFWTPEKVAPSVLSIHKDLDEAIKLRAEILSKI